MLHEEVYIFYMKIEKDRERKRKVMMEKDIKKKKISSRFALSLRRNTDEQKHHTFIHLSN